MLHQVNSVAWSCNGKRLATGSSDGCIKIWQPSLRITSKVERPETELTTAAGVNLLAWDPANPDRLLSVDLDKTLRLWDVKSARCLGSLKFSYSAQHAAWRPDGSDIVYLDSSDTLHVVSGATCKVTRSTRTKWKLNHFCFNADGTLLYVATTHKLLHVLSYETFERVRSVAVHTDSILYVTMAPEDRFLCTGGSDASVAIIDVKDLVALHYLHCDGEIDHVSVSSDACWIAFNEWSSGNVTSSGLWIASSKTGANHVPWPRDVSPEDEAVYSALKLNILCHLQVGTPARPLSLCWHLPVVLCLTAEETRSDLLAYTLAL